MSPSPCSLEKAGIINDLIMGYLSDRTRTRWGLRRPFLLFGVISFALAFMFLWWKPPFEGHTALVVYCTLMFIINDAANTLVSMPYFALTPELTEDYDERTELTGYRMFFSIVGGLISFVVPERMKQLNPHKGTFYHHGEADFFLAIKMADWLAPSWRLKTVHPTRAGDCPMGCSAFLNAQTNLMWRTSSLKPPRTGSQIAG